MATRSDSFPTWVARLLATYSLVVYLAGLLAIVSPRLLEAGLGTTVPGRLQQVVVVLSLAVMVVTYLAERRYVLDGKETDREDPSGGGERRTSPGDAGHPEYSLRARAAMAAAAIGVALAVYVAVALERPVVGALFILGAYLFVYIAYRHEGQRGEA